MPGLTSTRSPRVAEVRRLHDRKHRAERGAFVVEGPQAVEAAAAAGIIDLYVTDTAAARYADLIDLARAGGANIHSATTEVVQAMAETRQSQGLIATCPLVTVSVARALKRIHEAAMRCVVVLDRVADPGNAGTIIRTCDALGVAAVILTEGSVDPHNGKCVRSTAGSIFHIPIATDVPVGTLLPELDAAGLLIVAADAGGSVHLGTMGAEAVLNGPVAWVFGNEAHGVHSDFLAAAHETIAIDMAGRAESLNMASAAAICLYATAVAQRVS